MNYYISSPRKTSRAGGFTLVELLVVIAIMAVLATAGTVIFSKPASDMTGAASTVADILQQARTRAMSTNNYVYVGFAPVDDLTPQLAIALAESIDGLASKANDLVAEPSDPSIKAIRQLVILEGVVLDTGEADSRLPGNPLSSLPDAQIRNLEDSAFSFPADIVTRRDEVSDEFSWIIQFSPDGAARLEANQQTVPDFVVMGLIPALDDDSANVVGVIIDGPSGAVRTVRPEVLLSD